jgi:Zn-dependent M28 family amino/carboxypeptidase
MAGETLDAHLVSRIEQRASRNVIGVIKGTAQPDDYFLYTAHWDHLGSKPGAPGADTIYNGAIDNGMGVSSILEIAEAMAQGKPKRSVAFIAWTLEEQGLLGSQYFAQHPLWPPSHMVGGINIDANLPEGRAHDLVVIGNGASELEIPLAKALKAQGRVISPDAEPGKGPLFPLRPYQPGQDRRADAVSGGRV